MEDLSLKVALNDVSDMNKRDLLYEQDDTFLKNKPFLEDSYDSISINNGNPSGNPTCDTKLNISSGSKNIVYCNTNSNTGLNTKWSSIKYSRTERQRRKRERIQLTGQSLITEYYPILQQISRMIEENRELSSEFNKTLNVCVQNQKKPAMFFFRDIN